MVRPYKFENEGQRKIANYLDSCEIIYNYKSPLVIKETSTNKVWYPDFTLPEYKIIIEYFMNKNDNTRAFYDFVAHKILTYQRNDLDGIYFLKSSFEGDWKEQILERIVEVTSRRYKTGLDLVERLKPNQTKPL